MSPLIAFVVLVLEIAVLSLVFVAGKKRQRAQLEPELNALKQQFAEAEEKLQQAQADKQSLAELKYQYGQLERDHQALLRQQQQD